MSWLRNWTQTGQTGHEISVMEVLPSGFVSSSRIVKNLNITSDLETRDLADLKNRKIVDQVGNRGLGVHYRRKEFSAALVPTKAGAGRF